DADGFTPLLEAITWGSIDVARLLLARGASPLIRNKKGWGPLHEAVALGITEFVSFMLERYPGLVAVVDRWRTTPLHVATSTGDPSVVRLLLRYHANRSARDEIGRTALDRA
ncbi:ankyrin repeat-containing domain protein, partial [Baffinella frigidus]